MNESIYLSIFSTFQNYSSGEVSTGSRLTGTRSLPYSLPLPGADPPTLARPVWRCTGISAGEAVQEELNELITKVFVE